MTESGYGKRTQLEHYNTQGRGGQGVIGIKLTSRKGEVVAAFMVGIDDEIVAVSSGGVTIRMPVREISSQGRGRDRRAGDEPRRRPDRRLGGADPGQRGRLSRPSIGGRAPPVHRAPSCDGGTREVGRCDARSQRDGQAVPLAAALAALAVVLALAFGTFAGDVVDAARARTAADAAALASVEGGRPAAARLAGQHGATVVTWRRQGTSVTVTVRVGDAVATARAAGG